MVSLARFHDAQERIYPTALAELRAGRKRSHWMWFIFPQIAGLGRSQTARHYAIADLAEAKAYLSDPVLGARLRACIAAVLSHRDRKAREIFATPDDMKFRSCLTLFEAADPSEPLFGEALAVFYEAARDARTIDLLAG
ncbi:MAG: DUF1810 domain-containing protein [Kiloniellales bacterium]